MCHHMPIRLHDQRPGNVSRRVAAWLLALLSGCAVPSLHQSAPSNGRSKIRSADTIQPAAYHEASTSSGTVLEQPALLELEIAPVTTLEDLEVFAESANPGLRRLNQEVQALRFKARAMGALPDPMIGSNAFGHPIETAAGSQRANVSVQQVLPWLHRLDAERQRACFEAMAKSQEYEASHLKVVGDIRELWHRLYLLRKQMDINAANQELLQSLIEVANSRVATGSASQGDVLVGTLEYSRLEEAQISLRRQVRATKAKLNQLAGRDASSPLQEPTALEATLPDWNFGLLRDTALAHQPSIESMRLRSQATRWGIEVAKLQRRPNFSLNAAWFSIDANRPSTPEVEVGRDAWSLGATMTLPLSHRKYDALDQQARWDHAAAHSSVDETVQEIEAMLVDLWARAESAADTIRLYRATILPEAQATLVADRAAYANGKVDFDRIVADVRNILVLELGYHRAITDLAIAVARIKQAVGIDLPERQLPMEPHGEGGGPVQVAPEPGVN